MFGFIKNLLTRNIALKIVSLVLALALWFYIVNELNKGSEEERMLLRRVLPTEGMVAKRLSMRPIFIGRPRQGFVLDNKNVVVVPEYCIVVGPKDLLGKIRFAYTMPIDVTGASKTFTKPVSLNPIAPGVFTEETLVQITVPIERAGN